PFSSDLGGSVRQSSRDHHDLASFPTRRSSDLARSLERGPSRTGASRPSRRRRQRATGTPSANRVTPSPRATLSIACRGHGPPRADRKSTRLNSSHVKISYAVFCLKKKTSTTSS